MKVVIDLNKEGSLDAAIKKLERIAKEEMEAFAKELVEELAKAGADIARVNFTGAEYAGTHTEDVSFKISDNGKKATVYADGDAVLFIEFGTGIYKSAPAGEYDEIVSGSVLDHGEYKRRQGANPSGWFYTGSPGPNHPSDTQVAYGKPNTVHTYGNDANSSMYNARLEVEKRYEGIVRKVWERRNRT
jgi:hypothetical protein